MFSRFSKILVVDDSAVSRKILHGLLGHIGFDNVEDAANGRMALSMLQKQTYRLVISDWDMTPMSGLELLRAMRVEPRLMRIPFIMATAQSQKKFIEIARDNGTTHYLAKPFSAEVLAARIARIGQLKSA